MTDEVHEVHEVQDEDSSNENNEVLQEIDEILNREQTENETNLDELLAIIAEIGLYKKEILDKIKNVSESEGISLFAATKDKEVGILVGNEILTCIAKEDIDKYEKVTFASKPQQGAFVVPTRQYSKKILYKPAYSYDSDDNLIYIGEALPGTSSSEPKWRIKKLIYDSRGNVTYIETAFGSQLFDKIWDNRTEYSYS